MGNNKSKMNENKKRDEYLEINSNDVFVSSFFGSTCLISSGIIIGIASLHGIGTTFIIVSSIFGVILVIPGLFCIGFVATLYGIRFYLRRKIAKKIDKYIRSLDKINLDTIENELEMVTGYSYNHLKFKKSTIKYIIRQIDDELFKERLPRILRNWIKEKVNLKKRELRRIVNESLEKGERIKAKYFINMFHEKYGDYMDRFINLGDGTEEGT